MRDSDLLLGRRFIVKVRREGEGWSYLRVGFNKNDHDISSMDDDELVNYMDHLLAVFSRPEKGCESVAEPFVVDQKESEFVVTSEENDQVEDPDAVFACAANRLANIHENWQNYSYSERVKLSDWTLDLLKWAIPIANSGIKRNEPGAKELKRRFKELRETVRLFNRVRRS